MKSKVEFYKAFFEELEKKGFGVAQPSSPDYVVDIQFKGKIIPFPERAQRSISSSSPLSSQRGI